MKTLVLADHDNAALKDDHGAAPSPPPRRSAARSTCWWPAKTAGRWPKPPPRLAGVAKVLLAEDAALRPSARRAVGGADRLACAEL